MYCNSCNKVIADGSTFCCFCGAAVTNDSSPQNLYCPRCNREYDPTFPFCGICGTKLIPISTIVPPKPKNEFRVSNTFTVPDHGLVILGTIISGEINNGDVIKTDKDSCKIIRIENLGVEIKAAKEKDSVALLTDHIIAVKIGSTFLCEEEVAVSEPEKTSEEPSTKAPEETTKKAPEVIVTPPPVKEKAENAPAKVAAADLTPEKVGLPTTETAEEAEVDTPIMTKDFSENFDDNTPIYESGDAIMQINATSVYSGTKAAGVEILSGTIYIFSDRIDTMSNLSTTLTPFVKMCDIQSVAKSKYMHMWSSIVLNLKNGDAYTLASASAGSAAIDRALQIINKNISNG